MPSWGEAGGMGEPADGTRSGTGYRLDPYGNEPGQQQTAGNKNTGQKKDGNNPKRVTVYVSKVEFISQYTAKMTVHRAKQILSHLSTPRSNSNEPSSTSPSISELSILSGPKDVPLWEIPLGKLLDQRVALNGGNRDCCVSPATNGRWTYAQLQERSRHLARGLMALGIQKGDHIGILAGNCERYVE